MGCLTSTFRYHPFTRVMVGPEFFVLVQTQIGAWVRLPISLYQALSESIENAYTGQQFVNMGKDDAQKQLFNQVLYKFWRASMIEFADEPQSRPALKSVYYSLTNRCNLRCLHCSTSGGENTQGELSFANACRVIDAVSQLGPERLVLTGGEALVREDFREILSYASQNFRGKVSLLTNGTLIDEVMAKFIANHVQIVDLSLDGYDEASADFIRGAGVYKKVLKAVQLLKAAGCEKISLSMVSTGLTEEHKVEFRKLCETLDVKPIIRVYNPRGRGETNFEQLKEKGKKIELIEEDTERLRTNLKGKCFCGAGVITLSIDEVGNVYPCTVFDKSEYGLGNIIKDGVHWGESERKKEVDAKLQTFAMDTVEECKDCNVRYFCSSGCPASDQVMFANRDYRQIRCNQIKELYQHLVWG